MAPNTTRSAERTPRSRKAKTPQAGAKAPAEDPAGTEAPAEAPAGTEAPAEAPAGTEAPAEDNTTNSDAKPAEHPVQLTIEAISERVKNCMQHLKETDVMMRGLMKDAKKLCKKRASSGKPSNLTQPLGISPDLADFIGVDRDAQMTRGAVTKAINEYAVKEGLKLPNNGRIIKLDEKLATLLSKDKDTEVPIINVQTHLRDHFRKNESQAPPAQAVGA